MPMRCDKIFSYLCDYLLICLLPCLLHFEGIQIGESRRDKAAVGVIDNLNVFPWRQLKTTLRAAKIFWSFPYRQKKKSDDKQKLNLQQLCREQSYPAVSLQLVCFRLE